MKHIELSYEADKKRLIKQIELPYEADKTVL